LLFLYLYYWNLYGGYGDGLFQHSVWVLFFCQGYGANIWKYELLVICLACKTYCIWCRISQSFHWCIIWRCFYECMSVLDVILRVRTSAHTLLYITKAIFCIGQWHWSMPIFSIKGALGSNSSAVDSTTSLRLLNFNWICSLLKELRIF